MILSSRAAGCNSRSRTPQSQVIIATSCDVPVTETRIFISFPFGKTRESPFCCRCLPWEPPGFLISMTECKTDQVAFRIYSYALSQKWINHKIVSIQRFLYHSVARSKPWTDCHRVRHCKTCRKDRVPLRFAAINTSFFTHESKNTSMRCTRSMRGVVLFPIIGGACKECSCIGAVWVCLPDPGKYHKTVSAVPTGQIRQKVTGENWADERPKWVWQEMSLCCLVWRPPWFLLSLLWLLESSNLPRETYQLLFLRRKRWAGAYSQKLVQW